MARRQDDADERPHNIQVQRPHGVSDGGARVTVRGKNARVAQYRDDDDDYGEAELEDERQLRQPANAESAR